MTGREVIPTNRTFTVDELRQFLVPRWDPQQFNSFVTDPSMKRYTDLYLVLPGTARYMVLVYPGKNKVVLSYVPSPSGASEMLLRGIPTNNVFFGIAKTSSTMSAARERKGPLQDMILRYADHVRFLLGQAGCLK